MTGCPPMASARSFRIRPGGGLPRSPSGRAAEPAMAGDALFDALRNWRRGEAAERGVPAYVIFQNDTLAAIAERRPRDAEELAMIPGVGRSKLERYADAVLRVVRERR